MLTPEHSSSDAGGGPVSVDTSVRSLEKAPEFT